MRSHIYKFAALCALFLLSSCGAFFNQPVERTASRIGEYSRSTKLLEDLPEPAASLEVAVYNFSDQTGQFKAVENGSTFSTAVTQGATTILIKALEDSDWFTPIERENLSNLSTERNIIRNTKKEYIKNLNPNEPPLPPLLYAGVILEGGIISYDTNIITGGAGLRYFGLGGSSRYRQDRITIYLRAVSTNSGEILKTVYVSKTILSQALDASFFRFVKFQRLLEAETGITQNEPVQIAVKDAIEKAVYDLIMEGLIDKFWSTKEGKETNDRLIENYTAEKEEAANTGLHNRLFLPKTYNNSLSLAGGGTLPNGDYTTKKLGFYGKGEFEYGINNYFSLGLAGTAFKIDNGTSYNNIFASIDLNGHFDILPNDDLRPYIFAGPGIVLDVIDSEADGLSIGDTFFKIQTGIGVKYHLSPRVALKAFAEHNLLFSDELDQLINGKRDDFYLNFGFGVNYNFNLKRKNRDVEEITTD